MESDSEFLDRMCSKPLSEFWLHDTKRLFALARRGAAQSTGWEWMREQAAKVAETIPCEPGRDGPQIAAAIRALPPPPEGEKP